LLYRLFDIGDEKGSMAEDTVNVTLTLLEPAYLYEASPELIRTIDVKLDRYLSQSSETAKAALATLLELIVTSKPCGKWSKHILEEAPSITIDLASNATLLLCETLLRTAASTR